MNKLRALARKRPLIAAWIWICLIPPGLLWWAEMLPFVVIMSIYANIESGFATNAAKKEGAEMRERLDRIEEMLAELLADKRVKDEHGG